MSYTKDANVHVLRLNDEQWAEFQAMLNSPARDLPKLRALFGRENPFGEPEKPRDEQAERIRENLTDMLQADFSGMSLREMEDVFEDRDIAEFL